MSKELEAARSAMGGKSVLDIEAPEKRKGGKRPQPEAVWKERKAKRVPKTEVAEAIKSGTVKWNLGGVDSGAYKVSDPSKTWVCGCGTKREITRLTIQINCYRCNQKWERPEKGVKHGSR